MLLLYFLKFLQPFKIVSEVGSPIETVQTSKMSFDSEVFKIEQESLPGARRDEPVADPGGRPVLGLLVVLREVGGRDHAPLCAGHIAAAVAKY